jgi:DNA-3-methyladenine glycosylase I
METMKRCDWVNPENEAMRRYHDEEWGVPLHEDDLLFEMLVLEGAQAGLAWNTILQKRYHYRAAFARFDPRKVAGFDAAVVQGLLQNPGIVRNRLKIASAVRNAAAFIEIQKEFGTFDAYIWGYVDGKPLAKRFASLCEIPTRDELSDRISRDLKQRGMSFVGTTIIYAYMQAVGLINAHTTDCFRYGELAGTGGL